jgi:hypothetical protein
MEQSTSTARPRRAPSLAVVAMMGLSGALAVYAAVSALSDGHWLAAWRQPLLVLAALWLAAALFGPRVGRTRRQPLPDSGDLGCSDRY